MNSHFKKNSAIFKFNFCITLMLVDSVVSSHKKRLTNLEVKHSTSAPVLLVSWMQCTLYIFICRYLPEISNSIKKQIEVVTCVCACCVCACLCFYINVESSLVFLRESQESQYLPANMDARILCQEQFTNTATCNCQGWEYIPDWFLNIVKFKKK